MQGQEQLTLGLPLDVSRSGEVLHPKNEQFTHAEPGSGEVLHPRNEQLTTTWCINVRPGNEQVLNFGFMSCITLKSYILLLLKGSWKGYTLSNIGIELFAFFRWNKLWKRANNVSLYRLNEKKTTIYHHFHKHETNTSITLNVFTSFRMIWISMCLRPKCNFVQVSQKLKPKLKTLMLNIVDYFETVQTILSSWMSLDTQL